MSYQSTNIVHNNSYSSSRSNNINTNTNTNNDNSTNRNNKNKSFIDAFDKFNTNCTENMIIKKISSTTARTICDCRTDWSTNRSCTTIHQQQQQQEKNDSTLTLMTNDTSSSSSFLSLSNSSRSILSSNNRNCDDKRDSNSSSISTSSIEQNDDSWTVDALFTSTGRPNQYVGGYSPEWIAMHRRSYNIHFKD